MLATSHALTGAVIAATVPSPFLGYLLALISHPLLDFIPHWDFSTRRASHSKLKIIFLSLTDALVGIILGIILFRHQVPPHNLLLTMLLAQGPDWLESPYHVFDWHFPPFSSIKKLQHHWHHKLGLPWGLITQIVFLGTLYILAGSRIYSH